MTTPAAAPALMAPDLVAAFDALLCEGGGAPALPREWHVLDMAHGRVPVAMVADETKARAACEIWNGRHGYERFKVAHVPAAQPAPASAPAMVPQPVQQPQARAARATSPARGERRYVSVRDTETGEVHRVLTSVAHVGFAIVIFTPSNRHRDGALGGMLITHDDIRKAWVFSNEAEARCYLSHNRAPGERVIPAQLVADPAPAMVAQPSQQQRAQAPATAAPAQFVDIRTLDGDLVRRRGPFEAGSSPLRQTYLAEMLAAENHNRLRARGDHSRQLVFISDDAPAPAMVPQPCQQQQARHVARDASGRFRKAEAAPTPAVQAEAAPELPPVIDDVPRPAFVLTPEQDAWLATEERAAAADCRARHDAQRHDALILVACALAVLAVLATLLMAGPRATAQASISGPVQLALALAAPRAPPAPEAAACGRAAGMGEHGWQVEAARLTASTGTRSTVASLRATCAPAAR